MPPYVRIRPRSASISVDFGTSHTVVTVRGADGRSRRQPFDGSTEQDVATRLGIPDDRTIVRDTLEEPVPELEAGHVDAIAYGRRHLEDKARGEDAIEVGEPFPPRTPAPSVRL